MSACCACTLTSSGKSRRNLVRKVAERRERERECLSENEREKEIERKVRE